MAQNLFSLIDCHHSCQPVNCQVSSSGVECATARFRGITKRCFTERKRVVHVHLNYTIVILIKRLSTEARPLLPHFQIPFNQGVGCSHMSASGNHLATKGIQVVQPAACCLILLSSAIALRIFIKEEGEEE